MRKLTYMIIISLLLFFIVSSTLIKASTTATPIKHIIIIIQENHSFDNLFGTYPFGYPPIINNITLSLMEPEGLYDNYSQLLGSKNGVLSYISVPNVPWLPILGYSHPYYVNSVIVEDPNEGWVPYHGDYWFGKPIGFVYYSGPQSMAYFSYEQLSPLWDYAEEYGLADNYFAPVLGLTEPNRIAYLTGFPPPFYSDEASDAIPVNESIFYQLTQYNISWKYYVYDYQGGIPWPLNAFIGISQYKSHFANLSSFFSDIRDDKLPSVSWVMFIGCSNDYYDMHPPNNITSGELMLTKVINAVMESQYWNSSVIFITFDEGGGFYDQVVPPAINHYGLGQRIPLLIISPYAKEGYINNYTLSGYTLLGFIDYDFNLPYITPLASEGVKGLLESFNFSMKPRPPIILTPSNWTYPIPLQYPIHYGYIASVPAYKGYAEVYKMPELNLLLPLLLISFVVFIASFKIRRLLPYSVVLFFLTLVISGYIYEVNNIYQFITEDYLYTSLVGLIASGLIYARARSKFK